MEMNHARAHHCTDILRFLQCSFSCIAVHLILASARLFNILLCWRWLGVNFPQSCLQYSHDNMSWILWRDRAHRDRSLYTAKDHRNGVCWVEWLTRCIWTRMWPPGHWSSEYKCFQQHRNLDNCEMAWEKKLNWTFWGWGKRLIISGNLLLWYRELVCNVSWSWKSKFFHQMHSSLKMDFAH